MSGPTEQLDGLLETWRATRDPRVADAIEAVSAGLSETLSFDPHDPDSWMARARVADARGRGELLARWFPPDWRVFADQLVVVEGWPDDPRTAGALCGLLRAAPFRSHPSREAWARVYALLERLRDPRTPKSVPGDAEAHGQRFPRRDTRAWMRAAHERLLAVDFGYTPVPEADAAALAGLGGRASRTEADLLAAVYANPDDDAARLVYADALTQRGDPRGELIGLQLLAKPAAAQKKRAEELLQSHRLGWLGPLAPIFDARDLTFERGFPVGGWLSAVTPLDLLQSATGCDVWRTFRWLNVRGAAPGYSEMLADEALFGLRDLAYVAGSVLSGFVDEAPRDLERLQLSGDLEYVGFADALLEGRGLPALRRLSVWYITGDDPAQPGLDRILASPVGQALESLEIRGSSEAGLTPWMEALLAREDVPDALIVTCGSGYRHASGWELEVQRDGRWSGRATYKPKAKREDRFAELAGLLTRAGGRLARLDVRWPRYAPEAAALAALEAAAATAGVELGLP
ncbi:MAG: TIGR02996 domain-containing protein [Alphaproteobacteria bacterium]|nr:TIGR02996 domain-containing protein [Alphaproteobacteria bacterium]